MMCSKNLPRLMDAAQVHGLRVCIHLERFGGRTATTTGRAIRHLIGKYGTHPDDYLQRTAGWVKQVESHGSKATGQ